MVKSRSKPKAVGVQATPRAREMAKAHSIDIAEVTGSGKSGYVVPIDITRHMTYLEYLEYFETLEQKEAPPQESKPEVHEEHEFPFQDASPELVGELLSGALLPVSVLFSLRFRQDTAEGELNGDDVLAIRPSPVGGLYRSDQSILSWYVADRGYFAPEPDPVKPQPVSPDNGSSPQVEKAAESEEAFGVTE